PPTSPECSARSNATTTDQPSSPSAASPDSEPELDADPAHGKGAARRPLVPKRSVALYEPHDKPLSPQVSHRDSHGDTDALLVQILPSFVYSVRMARRRLRRKRAKAGRHSDPLRALFDEPAERQTVAVAAARSDISAPAVRMAANV